MNFIHKYLPEVVYGSIDGTVTTFAVIAGVAGAQLSPSIVLILGISNVLADGFSMASSNYLSAKSEADRDGEHRSQHTALWSAFATFISFVLIGTIPLLSYILSFTVGLFKGIEFPVSIILTALAFIYVGATRGKVAGTSMGKAALETFLIGAVAAAVSYGVGAWVENLIK